MFRTIWNIAGAALGRKDSDSNQDITARQKIVFKLIVMLLAIATTALVIFVQEKSEIEQVDSKKLENINKLELADKGLDTEKHWRNHFETLRNQDKEEMDRRLKEMELAQEKLLDKANGTIEQSLKSTIEKMELANRQLVDAGLQLKAVADQESNKLNLESTHSESVLTSQEFNSDISFDEPKPAEDYVPEGTYLTGYLLGGIVVSTALNTPDENATPVTIRLTHRGNLSKLNSTDISKCVITGSAYGDLSSERAVVRLEKLVCENDGMYITSNIAGQLYGADGYNGIKGTVVSTSSKHIKNAAIGGLIGGIAGAAKGQDGASISGLGLISTKKKGMGDVLGQGASVGASNAGDKIADYYLRQAEAMSPVLTVPSGVRVNAQIIKGFWMGETTTHKRIIQSRGEQK